MNPSAPSVYVVRLCNNGHEFFLRRTAWTSFIDRASQFSSENEARAALGRASKFIRKDDARRAEVVLMDAVWGQQA
jgi:hypothetical protein